MKENEETLYDRQIRLWGFEAQKRMISAKVLLCGLHGYSAEVAKNLLLAGIGLTLQDDRVVSGDDWTSLYFVNPEDKSRKKAEVMQSRLQELNTLAAVEVETRSLPELTSDYFTQFAAVAIFNASEIEELRIGTLCESLGVPCYVAGAQAGEGWFIAALGDKVQYKDDPPRDPTPKTLSFPSLKETLSVPWGSLHVKQFGHAITYIRGRLLAKYRNDHQVVNVSSVADIIASSTLLLKENDIPLDAITESNFIPSVAGGAVFNMCDDTPLADSSSIPVCSVIGGILSQEIVKVISQTGEPIKNIFQFAGDTYCGRATDTTMAGSKKRKIASISDDVFVADILDD